MDAKINQYDESYCSKIKERKEEGGKLLTEKWQNIKQCGDEFKGAADTFDFMLK